MADEKTQTQSVDQPEKYRKVVAKHQADFEKDRTAKAFYVAEMDENDKIRTNRHWDLIGPDGNPLRTPAQQAKRPNAVENITYSLVDGMVSDFAILPELVYFPDEADDEEAAVAMTDIAKHIQWKNHLQEEYEKWRNNFFWHGTGIWGHWWDPSWQGGKGPNRWVGEVRWQSIHPRAIFPDARCGENIHDGRRLHVVKYVTLDYIRDKYPEWGEYAQSEIVNAEYVTSDEDTLTGGTQDEEQILLVQTWHIGRPLMLEDGEEDQGVGLHLTTWCGESQGLYLSHANYVYFEPGEDARFPFTVRVFKARDGYWGGYGAPFFVKQAQILHNKNVELMQEGNMQNAFGHTFFQAGSVSPKQQQNIQTNGTLPRMFFEVDDLNGIKVEHGQSLPASLQNELIRGPRTVEGVLGRPDVTQGKNPGSVTAAAAIDLLQRKAASRFISPSEAITSGFAEAGDFIARLVWRNYNERRAYRIIDLDQADDQFHLRKRGVFAGDSYRNVYNLKTGEVMPLQTRAFGDEEGNVTRVVPGFMPEEGMVEGQDYEIFEPELDVRCKTSQAMPSDRMVNIEWANKLLQTQAIPLELFLMVVEKGRFPARREVKNIIEQWQAQVSAAQGKPQMGAPQGPDPAMIEQVMASLPAETRAQMESLPPEEQAQILGAVG